MPDRVCASLRRTTTGQDLTATPELFSVRLASPIGHSRCAIFTETCYKLIMQLKPCDCHPTTFVREPRSGWMRLLTPNLRHWSCTTCGQRFVASKAAVMAWQADRIAGPNPATGADTLSPPGPTPVPGAAG